MMRQETRVVKKGSAESDVCGEVFNVGSETLTSINELVEIIIKFFNKNLEPVYQKELKIIVRRRQAEISKIKQLLKFEPKVGLKDGLREVASDISTHLNHY